MKPMPENSDVYFREADTFPTLSEAQVESLKAFGVECTLKDQEMLFERGQRGVDFFVVLKGAVQVFEVDVGGQVNVVVTHGPGHFTGELDLFNNRQTLVNGRSVGPSQVLRINRENFRKMIVAEPNVGEVIMRAFILRRVGLISHTQGGVIVVGSAHDGNTMRIRQFLTRNGYPNRLVDTDHETEAACFTENFSFKSGDLPVVIDTKNHVIRNPTNAVLARELGLIEDVPEGRVFDVAVVGAGPAGLAAAVYAASEGLDTIVIESLAPGGQAGTSSKIENYLGFPTGISGQALAGRAQVQAQKFGAKLLIAREVKGLECAGPHFQVRLSDGTLVHSHSVVIASGARYKKLKVDDLARFEGQGIHYAATAMEAQLCGGEEVVVIGGGNSAGQAAVYLANSVGKVHMFVRGRELASSMSGYLIDRIKSSPKIALYFESEICGLEGKSYLDCVYWRNGQNGAPTKLGARNVFVMIGADPNTDWAKGCVELDSTGFVRTGRVIEGTDEVSAYQTSRPGVFAVGDVRSQSVKRVASAVGEGSVVVHSIHRYLAETRNRVI